MSYSQLQRREIYSARESPRTSACAHTQPARSSQPCFPLALGSFLCAATSGLSSRPGSSQGAAVPAEPGPGCAEHPSGIRAGMSPVLLRPGWEPLPRQELRKEFRNLIRVKLRHHGAENAGDGAQPRGSRPGALRIRGASRDPGSALALPPTPHAASVNSASFLAL